MSIKREELQVGITYKEVGETTRTILYIGQQKVMYKQDKNGKELLADIEVMLDVLDITEPAKQAA